MRKETDKEKECKKNLPPRYIKFVHEYLKTDNMTQSAIKAGYSPKTAYSQASRLLKNNRVQDYIVAIRERLDSDKIADIEEVMEYLTSVMRGEKKDQFDLDPALSERTKAASELAKRLDVRAKNLNIECAVNIIDDIPDSDDIEIEDDLDEESN